MKLYICYGTWRRVGLYNHPCGVAYEALREAGYAPETIRSYGAGALPGVFNMTPGRREVKRLTGNHWVPVMVSDDGTVIQGSKRIADWARGHPAGADRGTVGGAGDQIEGATP